MDRKNDINLYLNRYFQSNNFTILKEGIDLNNKKLFFAVKLIKKYELKYGEVRNIFNKGIIIEIKNNKIIPLLFIKAEIISDGSNIQLFKINDLPSSIFFGWYIDEKKFKFNNINFDPCWDEGKNVAGSSIKIKWNMKLNKYEYIEMLF